VAKADTVPVMLSDGPFAARGKGAGGAAHGVVVAMVAAGKKQPAAHWRTVLAVLPVARQLPAGHAAHEAADVKVAPPAAPLSVPEGQGKAVAEPVPVGQ
jgi:hypothetical protein